MKVHFYCGCNIGGSLFVEPGECHAEGDIEVDAVEWDEGFVKHTCPKCSAQLHQDDYHFERIEE